MDRKIHYMTGRLGKKIRNKSDKSLLRFKVTPNNKYKSYAGDGLEEKNA